MSLRDRFFDVLALAVLLVLAATLQQALGPWAWGLAKPPLLLCLAAYYALMRPLWLAVPAAFCAGVWADGLGSVPGCPALAAALALVAFCAAWGREQLTRTVWTAAFLGTFAALAATLLQALALAVSRDGLPDAASVLAARLVCQTAVAAPAALATAAFARLFERLSGNIEREGATDAASP